MANFNSLINADQPTSKKSSMFNKVISNFKAQFIPQKLDGIRIAMDGNICVPFNGEYVAINDANELYSYPEAACFPMPVYTIKRKIADIKVGDIIRGNNGSLGKVISNDTQGLKCLTYKGSITTKKKIVDIITNTALIDVVVNMFQGLGGTPNKLDPMMLMCLASDGDMDMKDLMMFQMMQGGSGMNMNPMMLMMLDKQEGKSSDLMEMMLMSQMATGSGVNFGNLFGNLTPKQNIGTKVADIKEDPEIISMD